MKTITGQLPSADYLLGIAAGQLGEEVLELFAGKKRELNEVLREIEREEGEVAPHTFVDMVQFMLEIRDWANLRSCLLDLAPDGNFSLVWGTPRTCRLEICFMEDGNISVVTIMGRGADQESTAFYFDHIDAVLEHLANEQHTEMMM